MVINRPVTSSQVCDDDLQESFQLHAMALVERIDTALQQRLVGLGMNEITQVALLRPPVLEFERQQKFAAVLEWSSRSAIASAEIKPSWALCGFRAVVGVAERNRRQ